MIRSDHFWYDMREIFGDPLLVLVFALTTLVLITLVSFLFVFLFAPLFTATFITRELIGERCPKCDSRLKKAGVASDERADFILNFIWRCPHDGYEEKERIRTYIERRDILY